MDANATDDDGLSPNDRQRLGIGTNHVVVIELGPDEVQTLYRSVNSFAAKQGALGFVEVTNYYQTKAYSWNDDAAVHTNGGVSGPSTSGNMTFIAIRIIAVGGLKAILPTTG